jgi:hypothetical protein
MQALADDPQLAGLEERALRGEIASTESALRSEIASVRAEGRADFRNLLGVVIATWVATILAVVGVLLAHL